MYDDWHKLWESVDEDIIEDLPDSAWQIIYDRLFYGNRYKRPKILPEEQTFYNEDQAILFGYNPSDIGVAIENKEDAKLAEAVANFFDLPFELKRRSLQPPFQYVALIRIPDEFVDLPAKDFVARFGLDINDVRRI